jgi:hypothetical protein
MDLQLFGFSTLLATYTLAGFCFMVLLLAATLGTSFTYRTYRNGIDRGLFWTFGCVLCVFALFRPYGLALDDESYVRILSELCLGGDCSNGSPIVRDYVWFWLVSFGLIYWPDSLNAALAISSLGVFIKLFVIDQLCRQRLLALLLLVPLSFIQYDMTQLRAGFASAWMMLAIYWLVHSKVLLSSLTLFSNFMVHSQAIFSPSLLFYRLIGSHRLLFPICVIVLLGLIFAGLIPGYSTLSWLGMVPETTTYLLSVQEGSNDGAKTFAWGYLPMLGYGVWLWSTSLEEYKKTANIAATSLLLGLSLAWFFALIPIMPTRLFDFYALPLVLLVGNVGDSKYKITLACLLAWALYLRLELFQDWILG